MYFQTLILEEAQGIKHANNSCAHEYDNQRSPFFDYLHLTFKYGCIAGNFQTFLSKPSQDDFVFWKPE